MKNMKIGKMKIGKNKPVAVIAEIADSHNGRLGTAKKMVDEIKKAGGRIAKFQIHLPDIEMVPGSINMWDGPLYDILKKNLFTPEMHKKIMNYCDKVGIEYICTPFCPDAVDILNKMGVKAFKTGSGELTNLPMQRKIAKICSHSGKVAIVSTGMSNWKEIFETVEVYKDEGAKDLLLLMNCTSEYPPGDYSQINLGRIKKMENEFNVLVGQSDHTVDNYTAFASVAMGARIIEKHFTLNRKQSGPDHKISLEPDMFKDLIDGVKKIEVSLGNKKNITNEEKIIRNWAYHSVVVKKDIREGEILTINNLIPKRPGTGIEAKYLDKKYSHKLLGKKANKNLQKNTILKWKDIY
ncbi:N-acetylneuraminate synthase family protein [bacterium]|nr:N-acetylneuraminate synthase family protein [bacterium]